MATGTYEYQSDFAKRHVAEGRAQGEARGGAHGRALAILAVLQARGVDVPAAVRERVLSCAHIATLDVRVARAATAKAAEEVVAE